MLHPGDGALLDVPDALALHATGPRPLATARLASATWPSRGRRSSGRTSPPPRSRGSGSSPRSCSAWRCSRSGSSTSRRCRPTARTGATSFPGFLIIGLGMPFAYVAVTIAAVAGTKPHEAGLASGLINTSQQIGGAVGIAILTTIAVSTYGSRVRDGSAGAGRPDRRVRGGVLGGSGHLVRRRARVDLPRPRSRPAAPGGAWRRAGARGDGLDSSYHSRPEPAVQAGSGRGPRG